MVSPEREILSGPGQMKTISLELHNASIPQTLFAVRSQFFPFLLFWDD